MAKKQAIISETAAAASPKRAAKPSTPRVQTAKHSKTAVSEPAAVSSAPEPPAPENTHEVIRKIAYGYWEARGRRHGFHLEDWVRAEHDYETRR